MESLEQEPNQLNNAAIEEEDIEYNVDLIALDFNSLSLYT